MRALIYDTETTGLLERTHLIDLKKQPYITEYYGAVVDLDTGNIEIDYDTLVNVPVTLSDKIIKITGITNDMLSNERPFPVVAPAIKKLIEDYEADIVIAHNLSFDLEMVNVEFERLGQAVRWPKRKICTVESTIHIKGYRLTLQDLHEHLFSEKFPEAHRARNDVQALIRCSIELYKRGELI